MDATTLRLILIVVGVLLILALYLWERRRARADDAEEDLADDVHWQDRREPSLDPWDTQHAGGGLGEGSGTFPSRSWGGSETSVERVRAQPTGQARPAAPAPLPEPDPNEPLIVQLSIFAPADTRFDGAAVVRAAATCGIEPGEMDVFHCYLGDETERRTLFRVANLVKPGTFPFGAMDAFTTPGLVLFASLDGNPGDLAILDEMVATARCLAEELNGEIRDETRSPFTSAKEDTLRARVLARQMARETDAADDA